MRREGALEVVAMLGDSVIDVQHLDRSARGRVSPLSWSVLVAGLAALATAGVLFAMALGGAATDARRLEVWTEEHRPLYAFRTTSPFGSGQAIDAFDAFAI